VQPPRHVEYRELLPEQMREKSHYSLRSRDAMHAKSNNTDASTGGRATGVSRSADRSGNQTDNRVGWARRECHAARDAANDVSTCVRNAWKCERLAVADVATRLRVATVHAAIVTDSRIRLAAGDT